MAHQANGASRHLQALRQRVRDLRLITPRVALAIESNGFVLTDADGELPSGDIELGETARRVCDRLLAASGIPLDSPLRLLGVHTGAVWFEEHGEVGPLQPFWIVVATDAHGDSRLFGPRRQASEIPLMNDAGSWLAAQEQATIGGDYVRTLREHVGHDRVFYPWCGLATQRTGRLLLVREHGAEGWHCPGGGVELGERPQQTIERELDEETGLVVESSRILGCWTGRQLTYPNGDMVQYVSALFSGSVVGGQERPDRTGEIAERGWFSESELPPLRPPWDSHVPLIFRDEAAVLD